MEHVDLIEEGVVPLGAEETIVTTDCDNETSSRRPISSTRQVFRNDTDVGGPPAAQRYEGVSVSHGARSVTQVLPSTTRPGVVRSAAGVPRPSAVSVPSRAGKLLMVRRSDGTTQFLRQIPHHSDEPLPSSQVTMMRARAPQTVRTIRGAKPAQISGESRTQSTPARVIMPTRTETRPVRTGFSQPVDPFMKRMAVEKTVSGADVVSSGLVRRQVIRPAESYEQVPYVDDKTGENVSYTEQVRTAAVRTSVSSGYDHSSALRRVTTPRGSMMASQGIQPNHNPHRVYYVKNVVATPPSRIVLAPTSVDTNDHEEIFLDNDGYVIDGGEIEDHTTNTHLS